MTPQPMIATSYIVLFLLSVLPWPVGSRASVVCTKKSETNKGNCPCPFRSYLLKQTALVKLMIPSLCTKSKVFCTFCETLTKNTCCFCAECGSHIPHRLIGGGNGSDSGFQCRHHVLFISNKAAGEHRHLGAADKGLPGGDDAVGLGGAAGRFFCNYWCSASQRSAI